ncbi:zinc ribbon domain-containing protein [Niallia sp. XMNu-256]|uniref:zinc ribbon domain-containing protein n=1 Tax=Niallia sp. XMNu-256 TaxID=3082444 RepID=UPI0030CEC5EE
MADIYEKIGSGISKIQGNLQSSQTITQYKKIIQEASLKRTEILIHLGEDVYEKFRTKELESEEHLDQFSSLIELDQKIYQSQQAIAALNAHTKVHSCPQCASPLTEGDRFCAGCGYKVELQVSPSDTATKECPTCNERIPEAAQFCNCCGIKIE